MIALWVLLRSRIWYPIGSMGLFHVLYLYEFTMKISQMWVNISYMDPMSTWLTRTQVTHNQMLACHQGGFSQILMVDLRILNRLFFSQPTPSWPENPFRFQVPPSMEIVCSKLIKTSLLQCIWLNPLMQLGSPTELQELFFSFRITVSPRKRTKKTWVIPPKKWTCLISDGIKYHLRTNQPTNQPLIFTGHSFVFRGYPTPRVGT